MLVRKVESCTVCDVTTKWEFQSVEHAGQHIAHDNDVMRYVIQSYCVH